LVEAARQKVQRFDLVEIDALFSALFEPVAAVCRRAGIPYVVPPRGQLLPWALREKRWKKMLYLKLTGRRSLTRPRESTAQTQSKRSHAAGRRRAPSFVVPTGWRSELRRRPAPADRFAYNWGFRIQRLLLFVGRFHRVKRLDVAVATLAAIESRHLLLAGPDEENLQGRAAEAGQRQRMRHRLHFLPIQSSDSLQRIYAAADLFILPSEMESSGMAAAEAMASGLPVLVRIKFRWALGGGGSRGRDGAPIALTNSRAPRSGLLTLPRKRCLPWVHGRANAPPAVSKRERPRGCSSIAWGHSVVAG